MKVELIFAWYDFSIGIFYDKKKNWVYIFPIPMVGIVIQLKRRCQICNKHDDSVKPRFGGAIQCYSCLKSEEEFEEKNR